MSQQKRKLPSRVKLDLILLFLCLNLWGYFLFFSPLFVIKNAQIQINGESKNENLVEEQIKNYFESAWFFSFYRKNYFLFSKNDLKEKLNENFFIKEVRAKKLFPNQMSVTIEMLTPAFTISLPYESLYIDSSGIVLEKYLNSTTTNEYSQKNLISITLNQDAELNIKDKIFSSDFLQFIKKIDDLFKEKVQGVKLIQFEAKEVNQNQGTIKAKLDLGYLLLTTAASPEHQIDNFVAIYKNKIEPQKRQFEYVDLRFGDKVYYK